MLNVLIVSLKPLSPVRSGFQNTVNLLDAALKKNFNVKFLSFDNSNDVDPVFNLSYNSAFSNKLDKLICKFAPRYIFVNTSKLLYLYNEIFFKNENRIVLICHDLYFFRKKYFKKNNLTDSTSITKKQEIEVLSKCKYIIDFSDYEYEYLIRNNITKSKLCFTMTPVKVCEFNYAEKKLYDFFYIGSKWQQNTLSLKYFFNQFFEYFINKKIKIVGANKIIENKNFFYSSFLSKDDYLNSKIGIAPIFEGTGRNVKIFDMMANSLPVITNKDLSSYGLKSGEHYILVNSMKEWKTCLTKLENSYEYRKFIAFNGWTWVNENCNTKKVFSDLIKSLN